MNYNIVKCFLGKLMLIMSALMTVPMVVSLIYRENNSIAYLVPIILLAIIGGLGIIKKPEDSSIHTKEGFLICTLSWVIISLFGALPFWLSGEIPSYTDAFFETVSGITTTGSTILVNIEGMSKSLLFWRSFSHWIGGMGILVFALAILSSKNSNTIFIMRAEAPGPNVGKLVSKTKFTARILYLIYIGLTALEVVVLLLGKMPLFDSIVTAFATAGTGGFSPKNSSIAFYDSAYIEYVISIFMLLFGVNFSMFYLLLMRNFKEFFKNEEIKWYFAIVGIATLLIWKNIYPLYNGLEQSFRAAFFQVSSIITTTGFISENFDVWPEFSKLILVLLMFCGSCAGSTGGGLKIIRVSILVKAAVREIRRAINPRAVISVNMDFRPLDEKMVSRTATYLVVYLLVMVVSMLILAIDRLELIEAMSSVITCINNIGPGLGSVGAVGNYSHLSNLSKWVLAFDMLVGRLELYPVLIMLHPSFWRK